MELRGELFDPGSPWSTKSDVLVDSSGQLVAYRLCLLGKVTMRWAVYYRGIMVGFVVREDSQWVHDNWTHKYTTNDDDRRSFLTRDNRSEWDRVLRSLTFAIRRAYKSRTANVVVHAAPV